jgi:predicted enzyme related to lactoylglutathione lyase
VSVRIQAITVDCHDPERVGRFWAEAFGWQDDPENPNAPGDPEWLLVSSDGAHVLFQPVPEPKTVKNRIHLDLQPEDSTRDETVDRLIGLGATLVGDHRTTDPSGTDGTGWVTLADIEGNEFCVVRSTAERATAGE